MNVGKIGEMIAKNYLLSKNYEIMDLNFRTRSGEIDIICKKGDTIVFVEVKTRTSQHYGLPYEAITNDKLTKIIKCSYEYCKYHQDVNKRIDCISIELGINQAVIDIKHFEAVDILGSGEV